MAQQANLQAATRQLTGKGAARTLRREGKVPGVIYGHGRAPEAVTVDTSALNKMLVGISAGTTIVDVVIDGTRRIDVPADAQTDTHRDWLLIRLRSACRRSTSRWMSEGSSGTAFDR